MKTIQKTLKEWLDDSGMIAADASTFLGKHRQYVTRLLRTTTIDPHAILATIDRIGNVPGGPRFPEEIADGARAKLQAAADQREQTARLINLAGCMPVDEEYPCTTCPWQKTCAQGVIEDGRLLATACESFYVYTSPKETKRIWQDAERRPSLEWYEKSFPEHDEDDDDESPDNTDASPDGELSPLCSADNDTGHGDRISLGSTTEDEQAKLLLVGGRVQGPVGRPDPDLREADNA